MIKVLKAGFFISIQDNGRFGYQHFGVPVSGAMDKKAFHLANSLVGNQKDKAVLECTLIGPKLEFHENAIIAITGATISITIDGQPTTMNQPLYIEKGSILELGKTTKGFRSYIAIRGGMISQVVMDSQSMYQHITKTTMVVKGDSINYPLLKIDMPKRYAKIKVENTYIQHEVLEVYEGPEFHYLNAKQQHTIFEMQFTISKFNNRMAYRLNESIKNTIKPIITSLVIPGTVQLTPSGRLIILHRDCQTTGGYPRILQLKVTALNVLAQKKTDDVIMFKCYKIS